MVHFVCFSASVYFCTYVYICAFTCSYSSTIELRGNCSLRFTNKNTFSTLLNLKAIIKSLLPLSSSHSFPVLTATPPSPSSVILSLSLPLSLLILIAEETWSFYNSAADTVPLAMMPIRQTVPLLSTFAT